MAGSTTLLQLLSVAVTRQRCLMSVVVGILSTLRGLWRTCTVDHEPYVGSGLWLGNANGQRRESESRERRTVRARAAVRTAAAGPGRPGARAGGAPQNPSVCISYFLLRQKMLIEEILSQKKAGTVGSFSNKPLSQKKTVVVFSINYFRKKA